MGSNTPTSLETVGCCYRPPGGSAQYFNDVCDMIDRVADSRSDIYLLGDMNIDWLASNCSLRKKLASLSKACNLSQIVSIQGWTGEIFQAGHF